MFFAGHDYQVFLNNPENQRPARQTVGTMDAEPEMFLPEEAQWPDSGGSQQPNKQ